MKLLSRSRLLASTLVAVSAMTISACSTPLTEPEAPPAPEASLGSLVGGALDLTTDVLKGTTQTLGRIVFGLVKCVPLQNLNGDKVVGPSGGTVTVGEYSLTIPAGALNKNVRITMTQVRDTVNSVRFGPEGLKFAKPAKLTMSYANCWANPKGKDNRIVYVDENLRVLETPVSKDDQKKDKVVAEIDHFSRYAIAW